MASNAAGTPTAAAATKAPLQLKPTQPPATASTASIPVHLPKLEHLPADYAKSHKFARPVKRIHDGGDVARFLVSKAYRDLGLFVLQLNHALCPRTTAPPGRLATASATTVFTLRSPQPRGYTAALPPSIVRLQALLERIGALVDEVPPNPGPRRFGNISFRTWHALLKTRVGAGLLEEFVTVEGGMTADADADADADDHEVSVAAARTTTTPVTALDEIKEYFLGGFGSPQRLDYGTGHELSFLAFLGCLWKLGVFADGDPGADNEAVERSIVLNVFEPYLHVVRKLIRTYTLEPAGSHGVWGLDDHSFLPYIFGSAQLTRPLLGIADAAGCTATAEAMPQEGSAPRVPKPSDVVKPATVEVQRELNLYFSAIGFIYDVKTGPFWEHSPVLFDVSGIKDGWGKINKGMIKMFDAEVLSKFPVIQHFPFGSLFSWDPDPAAAAPVTTVHMANQPLAAAAIAAATKKPPPQETAPWAQPPGVTSRLGGPQPATAFAFQPPNNNDASGSASCPLSGPSSLTRAPWAK